MLREDELRADCVSRTGLAELAQLRIQLSLWRTVELETLGRMFESIGYDVEHRPPIAGRASDRARLFHRIALSKQ